MDTNTVSILLCFTLHTNIKGKDHSIPAQMGCTRDLITLWQKRR